MKKAAVNGKYKKQILIKNGGEHAMIKRSAWNWSGVKIIKQIVVHGEPAENLIDEYYKNDDVRHFEETIVLIRAQSFDHAYKIAEANAKRDNEPYPNIYGQMVFWKFIDAVDCFLIGDEIKSKTEVYSCFYTAETSTEHFMEKYYKDESGCRIARHL